MLKTFLALLEGKQASHPPEDLLRAHAAYLQTLWEAGALLVCGPFADGTCAVLILRAPSLAAARTLLNSDPFIVHHYYATYAVEEFVHATPENNWLGCPKEA